MTYKNEKKNLSQNEKVYLTHTTTTQSTTTSTTITTAPTTASTTDGLLNRSLELLESNSRRQNLNISDTNDYFKVILLNLTMEKITMMK